MDGQEIDLVFVMNPFKVLTVKTESFFTKIHENDDPYFDEIKD